MGSNSCTRGTAQMSSDAQSTSTATGQPVRLYVKSTFITYRRGKNVVANPNHAILRIEGVEDKDAAKFYFGKRVAYIYRAKKEVKDSKYRCIWGKVVRAHGTNGAVRATFRKNLPPQAMGATLRVMLYPSRV